MLTAGLFKLADSTCTKGGIGLPGLYDNLCTNGTVTFSSLSDIWIVIGNVIRILITLGGVLAVIFIMVGGLFYVISAGDPAKVQRAKDILKQSITGLIIMIIAYPVITFIVSRFEP